MSFLTYLLFRIFILVFRFIPFTIVYLLSDGISFLLHRVLKYRYKVIYNNLHQSFPNKPEAELQRIIKATYTNLSDITLESIKGFTMTHNQLMARYKLTNCDLAEQYCKQGQNFIVAASHYANWEWSAITVETYIPFEHAMVLYKPLANQYINQYMRAKRERGRLELVSIKETTKGFDRSLNQQTTIFMGCDQSPSNTAAAHWVKFLNRDTLCLHGLEKHAKRLNFPILYFDTRRIKRGFYKTTLHPLCENPKEKDTGEVTALFMSKLESILTEAPENWLWSHKRWKHKKP